MTLKKNQKTPSPKTETRL